MRNNKAIIKSFENRLQILNTEDIYKLAEHDIWIFNQKRQQVVLFLG